eukprot:g7088.t1
MASEEFYVRYYVGHEGKFGHEFLEFAFLPDGQLRYANNSQYKKDKMIRKEVFVSSIVMNQLKSIVEDSQIIKEDDSHWPKADRIGKQELEIVMGRTHVSFQTTKIGTVNQIAESEDPEGLRVFYYLVQDLKCLVFTLMNSHFRIQPISK